jgi:hypothetical protein
VIIELAVRRAFFFRGRFRLRRPGRPRDPGRRPHSGCGEPAHRAESAPYECAAEGQRTTGEDVEIIRQRNVRQIDVPARLEQRGLRSLRTDPQLSFDTATRVLATDR